MADTTDPSQATPEEGGSTSVRAYRTADQQADAASEDRIAARVAAEKRSDDEMAAETFSSLGL